LFTRPVPDGIRVCMSEYTGACPPEFLKSAGNSTPSSQTDHSLRTNLQRWYLGPLGKMTGDEAFVCLCGCFPIYEKFLRATGKIGARKKFTETNTVFEYLGSKWGCSKQIAFEVWSNWRNGLLHKAMPKRDDVYSFFMCGDAEFDRAVTQRGHEIIINPWKLRECLFNAISEKREIWKDEDCPFLKVYQRHA